MESRTFDIGDGYLLYVGEDIFITSPKKYRGSTGNRLAVYSNNSGYLASKVNNKHIFIHQIVAEVFLGKAPEGRQINHKDGNKLNNHPDNLEYVTPAENIAHAIALGLHVAVDPTRSGRYKDGRCQDLKKYKREWAKVNYKKAKSTPVGCGDNPQ